MRSPTVLELAVALTVPKDEIDIKEDVMSLNDASTPRMRQAIIMSLEGAARRAAFAAGNPVLSAEVDALAANPRRIRKLSVDTACEAISWVDDPKVIEDIVAADSRQAVCEVARKRLRSLQPAEERKQLTPNEKNIGDRTMRALAKPLADVPAALASLKEVDDRQLVSFLDGLDDSCFTQVYPQLFSTRPLREVLNVAPRFLVRILERATPEQVDQALGQIGTDSRPMFQQALAHWKLHWGYAAGALAMRVYPAAMSRYAPPQVDDAVVELWRQSDRFDLLLWAQKVSKEEIARRTLLAAHSTSELHRLLGAVTAPEDADLMVATAYAAGGMGFNSNRYGSSRDLGAVLDVAGILDDTVVVVLATSPSGTRGQWLAGGFESKPSAALVSALAKRLTARDLVEMLRINTRSHVSDGDGSYLLLEELCSNVAGSAASLQQLLYPSGSFLAWIAARVVDHLGDSESAWSVFWTLLNQPGDTTFDEVIQAAAALA